MCAAHHVVLLAEETSIQIPTIITMDARPGDVCPLPYRHENKNFFALGRDERPRVAPLKHVSLFLAKSKGS